MPATKVPGKPAAKTATAAKKSTARAGAKPVTKAAAATATKAAGKTAKVATNGAKAPAAGKSTAKAAAVKTAAVKATAVKTAAVKNGAAKTPARKRAAAPKRTAAVIDLRDEVVDLTEPAPEVLVIPELGAVEDVEEVEVAQTRARFGSRAWFREQTDVGGASKVALFTLFGLNLVDEFDRLAFSTLTPEIRDAFDLTDQQIVAIGSVSSLFVLLAAIPVGYLADRMSRIKMARAAAIIWACMAVLVGAAWALPVLFAARFFSGVAKSSNEIVHTGLLADYYPPQTLPRVFKVHRLANPLSQVASLFAGGIAALMGWRWAFFLLAIPTFLLLGTLRKLDEPDRGAMIDATAARAAAQAKVKPPSYWQATKQLFRIRSMRRIWAGFFVFGMALLAFGQMLSLFFEKVYGFGPLGRGMVSFVFGIGSVVGILKGGDIGAERTARGDFASLSKIVAAGFLAFAAGVAAMGLMPFAPLSLAAALFTAAGISVVTPIFPSLMIRILPPNIRSQGQSFSSVSIAIGGLFAIPIAAVGENAGYRPAFLLVGVIIALSAPILWSVHRLIDDDVRRADEALLAMYAPATSAD